MGKQYSTFIYYSGFKFFLFIFLFHEKYIQCTKYDSDKQKGGNQATLGLFVSSASLSVVCRVHGKKCSFTNLFKLFLLDRVSVRLCRGTRQFIYHTF